MAHGRTVNDEKGGDSVITNTVVKGTRQLRSYLKQPFSRGNALTRRVSFRREFHKRVEAEVAESTKDILEGT